MSQKTKSNRIIINPELTGLTLVASMSTILKELDEKYKLDDDKFENLMSELLKAQTAIIWLKLQPRRDIAQDFFDMLFDFLINDLEKDGILDLAHDISQAEWHQDLELYYLQGIMNEEETLWVHSMRSWGAEENGSIVSTLPARTNYRVCKLLGLKLKTSESLYLHIDLANWLISNAETIWNVADFTLESKLS